MSTLVAMSSLRSNNWRRQATGSSSAVTPVSTAISATVTALCTGLIEPPRLISPTMIRPTMIRPPRVVFFSSAVQRATSVAMPSLT